MGVEACRLNCEQLEEVDYFKCLWSQVAADGGCERDVVHIMNEGYRAWLALKSVLNNRGLGINAIIFAWTCVLSDRHPAIWWISTRRGARCSYIMLLL